MSFKQDLILARDPSLDYIPSIDYTHYLQQLINKWKKNPKTSQYAYLLYDFENVKYERQFSLNSLTPMNPECLIPMDIDQCILGKKYNVSDSISTLLTQLSRYSKKRSTTFAYEWMSIYHKLQEAFIDRYLVRENISPVTDADISKHLIPVIEKMTKSGKIFNANVFNLSDLKNTFTIRFFLKDITKAVIAKTNDADKCGQGISAWSTEMNMLFCAIFRAIEEKFIKALKPNSLDANQMSEAEFDYEIEQRYDPRYPVLVNDYSQYDESQNSATQLLEDSFLEIFIPKEITKIYREMRLKAPMVSNIAKMMNEAVKNSGESSTEFMNQIVSRFICMLLIKIKDLIVEGYKGDDTFINAKKISLSNWLLTLNPELKIPMKSDIDYPKHVDFCGFYLSEFGVIPDILRYINKFLCKEPLKYNPKVQDYPEALRQSMDDRWKFMSFKKLVYLKEVYRDLYQMTDHQFDALIMTYKFFSMNKPSDQNYLGMDALYSGDNNYEFEDRNEADKNKKRIYSTNKGNREQTCGWW